MIFALLKAGILPSILGITGFLDEFCIILHASRLGRKLHRADFYESHTKRVLSGSGWSRGFSRRFRNLSHGSGFFNWLFGGGSFGCLDRLVTLLAFFTLLNLSCRSRFSRRHNWFGLWSRRGLRRSSRSFLGFDTLHFLELLLRKCLLFLCSECIRLGFGFDSRCFRLDRLRLYASCFQRFFRGSLGILQRRHHRRGSGCGRCKRCRLRLRLGFGRHRRRTWSSGRFGNERFGSRRQIRIHAIARSSL